MMGRLSGQVPLSSEFRLEDHVPADHRLRRVDAALDFGFVHAALAGHYSSTGRPSVDPELMLRMLLIGYLQGIRSERRLCEDVRFNLAYRWFCRLGLEGRVPNHSTFQKPAWPLPERRRAPAAVRRGRARVRRRGPC